MELTNRYFPRKLICRYLLCSFLLSFISQGWAVDYNQFLREKIKARENTTSEGQGEVKRNVNRPNPRQQRNLAPSSPPPPSSPSTTTTTNVNNNQENKSNDGLDKLRQYQKIIKNYNSALKGAIDSPDGTKKVGEIINNSQQNLGTQNPSSTRTPSSINEGNSLSGATNPESQLQNLLQQSQARQYGNQNIFKSSWGYLTGSSNDENMPKPSVMFSQVLVMFHDMPDEKLRNMFTGKIEGTFLEQWSNKYPKVLEFFIRLLKDHSALPSMAKIMDDRRKLIIFFICNIVVFVVGFIWKRSNRNVEKTYFERVIIDRIKYSLAFWGVRIGLVVYFFHQELTPFGQLFKNHFFT